MKRIAVTMLHVGYWVVYGLLILLFYVVVSMTVHHRFLPGRFWWVFWHNPAWVFLAVPAVLSFYLSYLFLFRFLKARRLMLLFVFCIGACIFSGLVAIVPLRIGYGTLLNFGWDTLGAVGCMAVIGLVNGVLALVMRGFISWWEEIRLKEELNRKNYEMELALIKSQLSPHFLFNTLNNIDVLIEKDAVRASAYLKKLSDILRFMLYETKTAQIPMDKELGYIEKYIELQRIRIGNPAAVRYTVEGQAGRLMVEPMLFMPFIENAFKHAERRGDDAIRIRFVLEEGRIVFDCENRYRAYPGGVGEFGRRSETADGSRPA